MQNTLYSPITNRFFVFVRARWVRIISAPFRAFFFQYTYPIPFRLGCIKNINRPTLFFFFFSTVTQLSKIKLKFLFLHLWGPPLVNVTRPNLSRNRQHVDLRSPNGLGRLQIAVADTHQIQYLWYFYTERPWFYSFLYAVWRKTFLYISNGRIRSWIKIIEARFFLFSTPISGPKNMFIRKINNLLQKAREMNNKNIRRLYAKLSESKFSSHSSHLFYRPFCPSSKC